MDSKIPPGECSKTKYANEAAANRDILRIQETSTRSNIPIRAYYCGGCKGWHLTSKEPHLVTQIRTISQELEEAKKEIERLNLQNKAYKQKYFRNDAEKMLRKDQEVACLNRTIIEKDRQINSLTKEINSLIGKITSLRKKRESPETPPDSV